MEDASLTTKGVVKLSSAVDSTSESLAATPKAVKAANDNANSRVPSNRKVNGKALTADITLTPKDIGTLNSVTMSFSGGAGWFKLATVTMPQASSIVYIALIGGAGYKRRLPTSGRHFRTGSTSRQWKPPKGLQVLCGSVQLSD